VTIAQAAAALRARQVSSVELTTAALEQVRKLDSLNAFITLTADAALARARAADADLAAGRDRGALHGVPIALKDLFLTRGVRTTGGSKVYDRFVPEIDAAVVERLDAAGAVMLGKLNMHEMAYGITSANPHFGPVRNPWNAECSPGGSSGGSGAAVAAGMVFAAMGSDTGGSIRIPASFCGTVGLKPTYGRVSRYGTLPLGYSLDHMGPLTRTVRDAAAVLTAIAGYDPRDPASSPKPAAAFMPPEENGIRGLRIGVPENFYFERIDPEVESAVRGALARAESSGAELKPVRVPDITVLNAAARVILLAEASAVAEPFLDRRELFGPDVLALFDQGRLIPATDYIHAQRLRRKLCAEFARLWRDVDCLCTPVTPTTAPRIGQTTIRLGGEEEDVRLATTRLVRGINALGLPALSIPCGVSTEGLPIGLQIVGAAFQEAKILRAGAALETELPPCPICIEGGSRN
jgi:aspartyl-tRNA(Asn)/glutamyl-tRNA(Gln) amidotransferase subunit A